MTFSGDAVRSSLYIINFIQGFSRLREIDDRAVTSCRSPTTLPCSSPLGHTQITHIFLALEHCEVNVSALAQERVLERCRDRGTINFIDDYSGTKTF